MYFFTSAPAAYDYAYVTTVAPANLPGWRVIRVEDLERFNGYQVPRYGSGLHPAFKVDSPEATAIGLIYDDTPHVLPDDPSLWHGNTSNPYSTE